MDSPEIRVRRYYVHPAQPWEEPEPKYFVTTGEGAAFRIVQSGFETKIQAMEAVAAMVADGRL